MKRRFKLINILNILNIIILFSFGYTFFTVYPVLPEKIPTHFNISLYPDHWGAKSGEYFLLVVIIFMNILLYTLIFLKPVFQKHTSLLNIPNKKKFLQLPLEKQEIYWELINELFAGLALIINFLFLNILYGTIRVALNEANRLEPIGVIASFILLHLYVIIYCIRLLKLPKKLIDF